MCVSVCVYVQPTPLSDSSFRALFFCLPDEVTKKEEEEEEAERNKK